MEELYNKWGDKTPLLVTRVVPSGLVPHTYVIVITHVLGPHPSALVIEEIHNRRGINPHLLQE